MFDFFFFTPKLSPRQPRDKTKNNRKNVYGKMHFYIDKCDEMARNSPTFSAPFQNVRARIKVQ